MKVKINRIDSDFKMSAVNENGNEIILDGSKEIGGHEDGFRPMQLLLAAVGGCSSIDVISILKKQKQEITAFRVEVDGDKQKEGTYSLFRKIAIHFYIHGNVEREKAEKAIQLSMEKYCSVSKTLEPTAVITHYLHLNEN